MHDALAPLHDVDWNDLDAVEHASGVVYQHLRDQPALLGDAVAALPERPELRSRCEHYDMLDKLVLYDHDGVRVRLHVFLPGHFDRPHNHRWTYSSLILRGSYQHYLYGTDDDLDQGVDVSALQARMVRCEIAGATYTLHHSMVHAVVAEPFTVSLVLRGPARKKRFLVMDRITGTSWWQYGARNETAAEARAKQMTDERLADLSERLTTWNLLNDGSHP